METEQAQKGELISPAKLSSEEQLCGIGLYPDRVFFVGEINIPMLTEQVFKALAGDLKISEKELSSYFNISGVQIDANTEAEAIKNLNQKLDILELYNRCEESDSRKSVLNLISKTADSPLFKIGRGTSEFKINTLAEIASVSLQSLNNSKWQEASDLDRASSSLDIDEECFYKKLIQDYPRQIKSYHKYFCIIQADGDKMGDIISGLEEGKLSELSGKLLEFGKGASKLIQDFGGIPIYAGGDDLLFLAPVISKQNNQNIFQLIHKIDEQYEAVVNKNAKEWQREGENKSTTMSYGVFISYYKHPLYEALNAARNLLFNEAKLLRNTIACQLYKHSGSSYKAIISKDESQVKPLFEALMQFAIPENMVSSTSHKLRANTVLWKTTRGDKQRLKSFFKRILDEGEKEGGKIGYLTAVRELLDELCVQKKQILLRPTLNEEDRKRIEKWFDENIYAMLRIAKFMNGEELKDE